MITLYLPSLPTQQSSPKITKDCVNINHRNFDNNFGFVLDSSMKGKPNHGIMLTL